MKDDDQKLFTVLVELLKRQDELSAKLSQSKIKSSEYLKLQNDLKEIGLAVRMISVFLKQ